MSATRSNSSHVPLPGCRCGKILIEKNNYTYAEYSEWYYKLLPTVLLTHYAEEIRWVFSFLLLSFRGCHVCTLLGQDIAFQTGRRAAVTHAARSSAGSLRGHSASAGVWQLTWSLVYFNGRPFPSSAAMVALVLATFVLWIGGAFLGECQCAVQTCEVSISPVLLYWFHSWSSPE